MITDKSIHDDDINKSLGLLSLGAEIFYQRIGQRLLLRTTCEILLLHLRHQKSCTQKEVYVVVKYCNNDIFNGTDTYTTSVGSTVQILDHHYQRIAMKCFPILYKCNVVLVAPKTLKDELIDIPRNRFLYSWSDNYSETMIFLLHSFLDKRRSADQVPSIYLFLYTNNMRQMDMVHI